MILRKVAISELSERRKSVTKCFRIESHVAETLDKTARHLSTTESALATKAIAQQLASERLSPAYRGITINVDLFSRILKDEPGERLTRIGTELEPKDFPLTLDLMGLQQSKQGVLFFMKEILCACWHWFEYPIEQSGSHSILLYHEYGKAWSAFLDSYLSRAFLSMGKVHSTAIEQERLIKFTLQD
jgi:hypothetical protein